MQTDLHHRLLEEKEGWTWLESWSNGNTSLLGVIKIFLQELTRTVGSYLWANRNKDVGDEIADF